MRADDGEEDQSGWGDACRREAAFRDLLDRHPERLTINAVELVACELGLSRPTLYRLIARYRLTRTVEGLLGPGRGRPEGTRVLDPDEEKLIREILEEEYLKPTRPPFAWCADRPTGPSVSSPPRRGRQRPASIGGLPQGTRRKLTMPHGRRTARRAA